MLMNGMVYQENWNCWSADAVLNSIYTLMSNEYEKPGPHCHTVNWQNAHENSRPSACSSRQPRYMQLCSCP